MTLSTSRPSSFGRLRRPTLAAAGLATLLAISACSAGTPAATTAPDSPVRGGSIVVGTMLDPTCVDPTQVTSLLSLNIMRQVVDSLTDIDLETGEVVPWLAQSWEVSPDGRAFTFHIRDGVTFSDETPFTAEVIKQNLDSAVALGAKAPSASGFLAGYLGTTVVDEKTATVTFDAPNAQFLQASSTIALGMVSPETITQSADERCANGVVGTGPFVMKSYTKNESVVLDARKGYAWASPSRTNDGDAYLDTVTFQVLPEDGVRSGALTSDNAQLIDEVPDADADSYATSGQQLITKPRPGLVASAIFNMASPIGSDAAVREAVMIGVNRADLVKIAGVQGSTPTGYLPETMPGALDLKDKLVHEPDAAKKLLEDAGWKAGADGIRVKDGQRLTVSLPYFFGADVVELLQQQLTELGIDAQVQQLAFADYIAKVKAGDFDVTTSNWARADAAALISLTGPNYRNTDPELVALMAQQNAEVDPQKRSEIVKTTQERLFDEAYAVPLWSLQATFAASPKLHGVLLDGSSQLVLSDAWLTK